MHDLFSLAAARVIVEFCAAVFVPAITTRCVRRGKGEFCHIRICEQAEAANLAGYPLTGSPRQRLRRC
ncbi:hypothetical protein Q3C01_31230 [Bradyrhizobium sp. UFLA05-109]